MSSAQPEEQFLIARIEQSIRQYPICQLITITTLNQGASEIFLQIEDLFKFSHHHVGMRLAILCLTPPIGPPIKPILVIYTIHAIYTNYGGCV